MKGQSHYMMRISSQFVNLKNGGLRAGGHIVIAYSCNRILFSQFRKTIQYAWEKWSGLTSCYMWVNTVFPHSFLFTITAAVVITQRKHPR